MVWKAHARVLLQLRARVMFASSSTKGIIIVQYLKRSVSMIQDGTLERVIVKPLPIPTYLVGLVTLIGLNLR